MILATKEVKKVYGQLLRGFRYWQCWDLYIDAIVHGMIDIDPLRPPKLIVILVAILPGRIKHGLRAIALLGCLVWQHDAWPASIRYYFLYSTKAQSECEAVHPELVPHQTR